MQEVADTFAEAGLPVGFFSSATEIFDRLSGFKDGHPDLDAVIAALDVRS